jgi:hypothetical protein
MNYMGVSRLVALLTGRAAGDTSQTQDEQSALLTPRYSRQRHAIQMKRLHSGQDSNPEETSFSQQGANYRPRKSALMVSTVSGRHLILVICVLV